MKAWYFSNMDKKLRYGDNRSIEVGVTHTVEGAPISCEHGLHASISLRDAIKYAPGNFLWEVELSGKISYSSDKCCATERTYLRGFDATFLLKEYARKCAFNVSHLWKCPETVKQFLLTGDASAAPAAYVAAAKAAYAADAAANAAAYAAANAAAKAAYAADAAANAAAYAAANAAAKAAYAVANAYAAAAYAANAVANAYAAAAYAANAVANAYANDAVNAAEIKWQEDLLLELVEKYTK